MDSFTFFSYCTREPGHGVLGEERPTALGSTGSVGQRSVRAGTPADSCGGQKQQHAPAHGTRFGKF